jgi:hypothetical protein
VRTLVALAAVAVALAGCLDETLDEDEDGRPPSYLERLLAPTSEPLLLAVHAVPGRSPTPAAVDTLQAALQDMTGRPVDRQPDRSLPRQPDRYTTDELVAALSPLAEAANVPGAVVLHVFAVNGNVTDAPTESGGALGLYLGKGITVAFMDDLQGDFGLPGVSPQVPQVQAFQYKAERAVLVHEAGHAMGLVACGTPMVRPHNDTSSPCHSHSDHSVMWKGVHQALDPAWLQAQGVGALDYVWTFDEDDRADVRAFQAALAS